MSHNSPSGRFIFLIMDEIFETTKEIYETSHIMATDKGYVSHLMESENDRFQLNVYTQRKSNAFSVPIPDELVEDIKKMLIDYYVEQIINANAHIQELANKITNIN